MSRSNFEEWLKAKCEPWDFVKFPHGNTEWFVREQVYQSWLAGRESMRDEVCPIIFGQCDSDNVAQRTVDAIRKIEL